MKPYYQEKHYEYPTEEEADRHIPIMQEKGWTLFDMIINDIGCEALYYKQRKRKYDTKLNNPYQE